MIAIRSRKDFASGIMFAVIGGGVALIARDYDMGTARSMGPGFFPFGVGLVLALVGLAIAAGALGPDSAQAEPFGAIAWRPLLVILLANALFGVMLGGVRAIGLPPLGLIPAVIVMVLVAAMASPEFRLAEVLLLAPGLAMFSYVIFGVLLRSPLEMLPTALFR